MRRPLEWYKIHPAALAPTKAYGDEDACYDLYSAVELTLKPGERAFVDCGIGFNLPDDLEIVVRGRSSMALKAGVWCHVGTVDSGWRDSSGPILINLTESTHWIKPGDKVCQIAVREVSHFDLKEVSELAQWPSARGKKGFGSSGK